MGFADSQAYAGSCVPRGPGCWLRQSTASASVKPRPQALEISPHRCSNQVASDGLDEAYPLWAISSSGVGGLEYSTVQVGEVSDS